MKKRPSVGDVVGGFVAGLYSVPEGIGYASLAGINPMMGIYAGIVPVAVAAATTGSVLMMSTLTSAIALTIAGVVDQGGYQGAEVGEAVVTLTLVAGALMAALGALKLGRIVTFVSNAVMTGFVMGVAILILVGKLSDIVGYDPDGYGNKVVKGVAILLHPGRWDATTATVGIATIAAAFALKAIPLLERYALVLVVVAGTAIVWAFGIDVETIGDQAVIATGLDALPFPSGLDDLPHLSMVPGLLAGAVSIAIVALAQGAGIRQAFPNPDGSPADASRDFLGQGLGNVGGSFFLAPPTGGSLSRTAVSAEGGATSRWAGVAAAASVALIVVALGGVVSEIPEAVIGGLLLVIGVELVLGRLPDARLAVATGRTPRLLFVVTLVLTLAVPLQWAIFGGALLSLLAYVAATSRAGRLQLLTRDDEGWLLSEELPATLRTDAPTVLRYRGPNFFAVVSTVAEDLPAPDPDQPGVLVLDLGVIDRYTSTALKQMDRYLTQLEAAGSGLVLVGVSDSQRAALRRTGFAARIGEENLLAPEPHLDVAIEQGLARGRALLDELRRS